MKTNAQSAIIENELSALFAGVTLDKGKDVLDELKALDPQYEKWEEPNYFSVGEADESMKFKVPHYDYLSGYEEVFIEYDLNSAQKNCYEIFLSLKYTAVDAMEKGYQTLTDRFKNIGLKLVEDSRQLGNEDEINFRFARIELPQDKYLFIILSYDYTDNKFIGNKIFIGYNPCSKMDKDTFDF